MVDEARFRLRSEMAGFMTIFLVLASIVKVTSAAKPVPDTKGREFLFSTPLCVSEFPAKLYIIPQTTEAVNVSLITGSGQTIYGIPEDGVLRQEVPCSPFEWGEITDNAMRLYTDHEVNLYIEYAEDNHIVQPLDTHGTTFTVFTPYSFFLRESFVVIMGNSSAIEITLPEDMASSFQFNNTLYRGGSTFTIDLQANETAGFKCYCDLTGVRIRSEMPLSVVVGSMRSGTSLGVIDQLPPENIWGRRFIFADHPSFAKNVTLKITGVTPSTHLSVSVKESTMTSLDTSSTQSMQLYLSDVIAVESNTSIICLLRYDIHDNSNNTRMTFKFLTPLLLFHVHSTFTSELSSQVSISANFILTVHSYPHVLFNTSSIEHPFQRPMIYFWRHYICKAVNLKSPYTIRTNSKNVVPYYASVIRRDANTAYEYSLGMRITSIYEACVKSFRAHGGNGDGIDNDCDNMIDEEYLNRLDDDHDGYLDEDVHFSGKIPPTPVDLAWEYYMKNRESDEGFSMSVIAVIISISVAVFSAFSLFAVMILIDRVRQSLEGNRVGAMN